MTPRLLDQVGRALYGDRFAGRLSEELGVSRGTVGRWLSGREGVPEGVWHELEELMIDRSLRIEEAALAVRRALGLVP